MKKCNIIVYDYKNNPHKISKYEVEAWCVGGEYGILAYFIKDHRIYEAHGDDGHWWLSGGFDLSWLLEIVKVLKCIQSETFEI